MGSRLLENLGWKLLSLGLAFALWFVVMGEQKAEVVLHVPLEIEGVPEGMMVINEPAEFVSVKLRGPRSLVMALHPSEIGLAPSPKQLAEGENLMSIPLEGIQVPRGIEVLLAFPDRIRVVLERVGMREVEVSPRVEGTPAPGYLFKRASASPSRVKVVGPRSELRRLQRVHTLPIDLEGRSGGFTVTAPLEPPGRHLKYAGDGQISVSIEIGNRQGRRS